MKSRLMLLLALAALFLFAGIIYEKRSKASYSVDELSSVISASLGLELKAVEQESAKILNALDANDWSSLRHTFFLIQQDRILNWSRNDFVPEIKILQAPFQTRLVQVPGGDYLLRKWELAEGKILVAVIVLRKNYRITNQYLTPHLNTDLFPNVNLSIAENISDDGTPVCVDNYGCLFRIVTRGYQTENNSTNLTSLLLVTGSLLLCIAALCMVLFKLHEQGRFQTVYLLLLGLLATIRWIMIEFDFPLNWGYAEVFDPQQYAASSYNKSLGDLVLNSLSVTIACSYLFFNYSKFNVVKHLLKVRGYARGFIGCIALLTCLFSFLFPFLFYESIFHNSSISLDITQSILFDRLRVWAFVAVFFGTLSGFLFSHIFFRIAVIVSDTRILFLGSFLVAILLFSIYNYLSLQHYTITLVAGTIYFVILYLFGYYSSVSRINYRIFLYFFLAIAAFSVQGAFSVEKFTEESKARSQFRFANNYLINQDVLGEYLLNDEVKRVSHDPFIQSRLASPFLSKSIVRQKIKQVYLNPYFDRYDTRIYLYNSSGRPFDNQSPEDFATLIRNYQAEANRTHYDNIYFVRNLDMGSIRRYLAIIPVKRFSSTAGFIVLDLSLKKVIPKNVYPELLIDNRFAQFFKNKDYSFAYFSNNKIVGSFGDFNYEKDFDTALLSESSLYQRGVHYKESLHAALEDDSGRIVVVSSPSYSFFYVLANFSFLFITSLGLLLLLLLMYGFFSIIRGFNFNYSARIQIYIYLSFLLPLVIVSLTTLNLITRSAEKSIAENFKEEARSIGESLAPLLNQSIELPVDSRSELEDQLSVLAKASDADASVYDSSGVLLASSQPLIFDNQISSELMNRRAWEKIVLEHENYWVGNEEIGKLRFNSSYFALKSPETGKLIGILNLPFFGSAFSLEQTRITVFANILIIFVSIFIVFSILSFLAVDWLTFPLRLITRTLGQTTLTRENKPLQWKADDEIGMMVREYNRMVGNLESSKSELARIHKESAWREIAKQVAHEIKNPLTPMKLTLQQMEYALIKKELSAEKTTSSVKTLLTQVDILNDIASSFSTFARMPTPVLVRLDLNSVLKKTADLYANHPLGDVHLVSTNRPVFVLGDEPLLSRVFSNIILNGLQSGGENRKINMLITVLSTEETASVSFGDDGAGIEEALREKIFVPQFSTKKTGSGLGLAIAKQGIEQMGGKIWFETSNETGTVFFIELPIDHE